MWCNTTKQLTNLFNKRENFDETKSKDQKNNVNDDKKVDEKENRDNDINDNNNKDDKNDKIVNNKQDTIIVYSSDTCPYCKKAKDYLKSKGIKYEERNISQNSKWAEEVKKVSGQNGIPVIVYKDKVVVGFDQRKLDELINQYNQNL